MKLLLYIYHRILESLFWSVLLHIVKAYCKYHAMLGQQNLTQLLLIQSFDCINRQC